MLVPISDIKINPGRREVKQDDAQSLAESISEVGLLNPITRLAKKQDEIERCQKLLRSLYENLADDIIDKNEYQELKSTYQNRRSQAEEQAEFLREEMSREQDNSANDYWIEEFCKRQGIDRLDRRIVVSLIERVLIYREHRVEIVFRWHNEFELQTELVAQAQKLFPDKEAV